jgi:kumamolisin
MGSRGPSEGVAARVRGLGLLALTAAAVLVVVWGLSPGQPTDAPAIGGPLAPFLAGTTDLGLARDGHAELTAALANSTRPQGLIAWAANRGLSVRWRPGQDWAFLEGAPAKVADAFGVAVHNYRSGDGHVFYASPQQPAIPVAVRAEVTALGRILGYRPPHLNKRPNLSLDVPGQGLTPTQLRTTYNAIPSGATGAGQTIVFFEWAGWDQTDLDAYTSRFGLPRITPTAVGQLRTDHDFASSVQETMLDLEVAHAVAPQARLVVVDATPTLSSSGPADTTTYENVAKMFNVVDQRFPGAVWSLSIGWGCDRMDNAADLAPVRAALVNAHSHGTSSFDASGDTGGFECKDRRALQNGTEYSSAPGELDIGLDSVASLPEMTDVGGTALSTDANGVWLAEQTWVESPISQGTGGGVSAMFARPDWQGALSLRQDSTQTKHRLTPDVAAEADPSTGVLIISGHTWGRGGGTSQAAPTWAGLAALMDQYLLANGGHELGDLNPLLYRAAAGTRPAFHDVTVGGNAINNTAPGYDLVTGLGTPNMDNLVHDLLDIQKAGG